MSLTSKIAAIGVAAGIAFSTLASPSSLAYAFERDPKGYNHLIPDFKGLPPYNTLKADINEKLPGDETTVKLYKSREGYGVATLEINGIIYAIQVNPNGPQHPNKEKNYTLLWVDKSSGLFTLSFKYDEKYGVPDWLVDEILNESKPQK